MVITGGEPMLQLDPALVDALHDRGFRVAVESSRALPAMMASTGFASVPRQARMLSSGVATS